jgi:hypothetical protein
VKNRETNYLLRVLPKTSSPKTTTLAVLGQVCEYSGVVVAIRTTLNHLLLSSGVVVAIRTTLTHLILSSGVVVAIRTTLTHLLLSSGVCCLIQPKNYMVARAFSSSKNHQQKCRKQSMQPLNSKRMQSRMNLIEEA